MKCRLVLFVALFLGLISIQSEANEYTRPYAFAVENQKWWQTRQQREEFKWVDHLGHTNTAVRAIPDPEKENPNTKVGGGNNISGEVRSDLAFVKYHINYGSLNVTNYSYDISQIAPGTYDLINGKWYTDMTDEEKHAKWAVYTNEVIQSIIKDLEERRAPAKFDVQKTPEEYKSFLLAGRPVDTLTPEEEEEIEIEYAIYLLEWTRVNDPENYKRRIGIDNEILSERQKKERVSWTSRRFRKKSTK